jgi:hypothetical protein
MHCLSELGSERQYSVRNWVKVVLPFEYCGSDPNSSLTPTPPCVSDLNPRRGAPIVEGYVSDPISHGGQPEGLKDRPSRS